MEHSLQQMQQDSALQTDVVLRNEMLRLQLSSTLLRLALWQAPDAAFPLPDGAALDKFKRFRQKLEYDFATHHQVQHYANALGMSEKSLSRACIAATGMPAKAYICQRLVLESKRLLAHTSKHVQTISYELGFDDATNFVKFFRRATGMTPVAFRQGNVRAGQ
jgi:AraC-like DNA-binding protein